MYEIYRRFGEQRIRIGLSQHWRRKVEITRNQAPYGAMNNRLIELKVLNTLVVLMKTYFNSQVKATDVRNSSRNIWDSKKEAKKILKRIRDYLPETWNGGKLVELNERLYIYHVI